MANISTAKGYLTLDFSKVKKVSRKQVKQLLRLFTHRMDLGFQNEPTDRIFTHSLSSHNTLGKSVQRPFAYEHYFYAEGRWCFANNLRWIMTQSRSKYRKILRRFKGLEVEVQWEDYEPGNLEINTGVYKLVVKSNEIVVEESGETLPFTLENFVSLDFGDEDEFREWYPEISE